MRSEERSWAVVVVVVSPPAYLYRGYCLCEQCLCEQRFVTAIRWRGCSDDMTLANDSKDDSNNNIVDIRERKCEQGVKEESEAKGR